MTRKRGRNLTDEEQSLWNRVAQKIKPLEPEKKHVKRDSSKSHPPARPSATPPPQTRPPFSLTPEPSSSFKNSPTSPGSTHRITRVRNVKIEACLDLHGLTRDQARLRLTQFLISRQQQRCLWVLVITGKGRRNLESEEPYGAPLRAILRDLVPQWLEEKALKSVVSAYTTAKPQDGGSGALYVRLKRLN